MSATLVALNSGSASATIDPVGATFGVTGVATSNCEVSIGGTDVYVKPGQELDVKTSIVGLTLLGVPLDLSKLASLNGALVIDPRSDDPTKLDITNKVQKLNLPAGDHKWTWTVNTVQVGLLKVPLQLSSSALKLGAKLSWDGVIHVTPDAADCGVAVQLPSVSASVSVTGLPPIGVGIPGVKITLPIDVPTALPTGLPGGLGSNGGSDGGNHSGGSSAPPVLDNPIPVPAKVVPGVDGSGLLGGGLDFGVIPAGPIDSVGDDPQTGGGADPVAVPSSAAGQQLQADQLDYGKRPVELAASQPAPTGEVWVVLAILAVIALAFVAATYARLYLLRREG